MRGRHSSGLRRICTRVSGFVCLSAAVQLIAMVELAYGQGGSAAAPEREPLWWYIPPTLVLLGILFAVVLGIREIIGNVSQATNSALIAALSSLPWGKLLGLYTLIYLPSLVGAWALHLLDRHHLARSIINVGAVPVLVLLLAYYLNLFKTRSK
jgi:hypothetical protein